MPLCLTHSESVGAPGARYPVPCLSHQGFGPGRPAPGAAEAWGEPGGGSDPERIPRSLTLATSSGLKDTNKGLQANESDWKEYGQEEGSHMWLQELRACGVRRGGAQTAPSRRKREVSTSQGSAAAGLCLTPATPPMYTLPSTRPFIQIALGCLHATVINHAVTFIHSFTAKELKPFKPVLMIAIDY